MPTFKDLSLSPEIQVILEQLGFIHPTEIQKKAIPLLLSADLIDFHGQAQTGTGKTLAFGIPLIEKIDKSRNVPQALIVAPTRELAVQIFESLQKIGQKLGVKVAVMYGGMSMEGQIYSLKRGVHIVVGTPGRLNDHLRRKTLDVSQVKTLVLDEADIMLEMGFKEEVDEIMSFMPHKRQIWLFSATIKPGIAALMKKHMHEPLSVRIAPAAVGEPKTKQFFSIVPFKSRLHAITRFIQTVTDFYGFIFCQTKILASDVAEDLIKRGYNAAAIHGDLSQAQRNAVIKKFKNRENTILVATDVAARGIDVPDITHVINYSIPEDSEGYVHRIGRTGRAGKEGTAITFIGKSELRDINHIAKRFGFKIDPIDVPSREVVINKRLAQIPAYIEQAQEKKVQEEILPLIQGLSIEEFTTLTAQLLADKFLSTLDLEDIPYTHVETETPEYQEIYLNLGQEDGITQEMVRNYLLQTPVIKPEQILTIRVIKKRSFIKLSTDCSPDLISSLRGKRIDGHAVEARVTCTIGEDGGRGRGDGRGRDREGGRERGRGGPRGRGFGGGGGARRSDGGRPPRKRGGKFSVS